MRPELSLKPSASGESTIRFSLSDVKKPSNKVPLGFVSWESGGRFVVFQTTVTVSPTFQTVVEFGEMIGGSNTSRIEISVSCAGASRPRTASEPVSDKRGTAIA